MTSARFKLDMFEGPLDLLLHLISKHKLNIYDIEIAVLLEQYLDYLANLDHEDYEDAADFLEMAARLIYIKTCSLLPQDEEAHELKKELEGRIIEYSLCKKAAQGLVENYVGGDVFVRSPIKLPVNKTFTGERDPETLRAAMLGISEKARTAKPLKANVFQPIVSHKIVSVTSKIIFILKKLYTVGEFEMDKLYDGIKGKSERVATFLAVLELTKSGRIFLNDDNTMIRMNSLSHNRRNAKVTSEYEPVEEQSSVQTADTQSAAVPLEELDTSNSLHNEIESESTAEYVQTSEIATSYKPAKPKKHYATAKIAAVECTAPITVHSDVYSPVDDVSKEQEDEVFEKSETAENEVTEIGEYTEETPDNSDITEPIEKVEENNMNDVDEALIEELELLSKLSVEDIRPVFKPNYKGHIHYYWGYSPEGDNAQGNYWKYGLYRY